MLPPIPTGVLPVTAQQDLVKPRPDIPPVTPAQPSANESEVALDKRHPQESAERLAEEQRRRRRQQQAASADVQPADEAEEPVEPQNAEPEEIPRLGGNVDISV